MNRTGRAQIMPVEGRVGLLEEELTEHETSTASQIVALRTEMKASAKATNQLLFGILIVLLTVLGGFITTLLSAR